MSHLGGTANLRKKMFWSHETKIDLFILKSYMHVGSKVNTGNHNSSGETWWWQHHTVGMLVRVHRMMDGVKYKTVM